MTTGKSTKRALTTSVLAMVLCVALLVGTTFAWFTDSVTSGKNKIVAGGLDVELYHGVDLNEKVDTQTKLFTANDGSVIQWEPGVMVYENFRVSNAGSLALKYKLAMNIVGYNTIKDTDLSLKDVLKVAVVEGGFHGTRENAQTLSFDNTLADCKQEGSLSAGAADDTYGLVVYWEPGAADNEYNLRNGRTSSDGDPLYIDFGITLAATQDTVESDSFGNDYDGGAPLDFMPVSTVEDLKAAITEGKAASLTEDVAISEALEVSGDVTIYGNGKTITVPGGEGNRILNVTAQTEPITITLNGLNLEGPDSGSYTRGISLYDNQGKVDLIMDDCSLTANYYALNIASANKEVEVTIKNSILTGWCAAQTHSANTNLTFENCTLIGNNDVGYNADGWNNFATVVINGYSSGNPDLEGAHDCTLTLKNCRVEANQTTGNQQWFLIVGAKNTTVIVENCTFYADGVEVASEDLQNHVSISADTPEEAQGILNTLKVTIQ